MDAKFYVLYETARLLREKGYPQSTDTWYAETKKGVRTYNRPSKYENIARPTYHEVLDWLFNIGWLVYARNYGEGTYFSTIYDIRNNREIFPVGSWRSREDALDAAILEVLRLYVEK